MKLNTKIRYGLRAMIEIAGDDQKGLLQKEIAERQQIPLKYLDSIITGLRTKGLIRNLKGKKSGYVLAKSPENISVYDIFCAFEPEISLVDCLCEPEICHQNTDCRARGFWLELNSSMRKTLVQKKLSEFLS